jgi:Holliday junction resolvase RusA-like endonuclease
VSVEIHLALPRKNPRDPFPTNQHTGDIDKHARNILDALADAGVYANDSQVVLLQVVKLYAQPDQVHAAVIVVSDAEVTVTTEYSTDNPDVAP